jgi:hypothetical protein
MNRRIALDHCSRTRTLPWHRKAANDEGNVVDRGLLPETRPGHRNRRMSKIPHDPIESGNFRIADLDWRRWGRVYVDEEPHDTCSTTTTG